MEPLPPSLPVHGLPPSLLHNAVFWLWVSFALFVGVVGRPAFRAIVHLLDRKRAAVDLILSDAARQRKEAANLLAQYRQQMEEETEEARRMIENAQNDVGHMRVVAAEKLKQTLAAREALTASHIAEAEAASLRQAEAFAASLALATSREILTHDLPPGVDDLLVDQAIAEIPAKVA